MFSNWACDLAVPLPRQVPVSWMTGCTFVIAPCIFLFASLFFVLVLLFGDFCQSYANVGLLYLNTTDKACTMLGGTVSECFDGWSRSVFRLLAVPWGVCGLAFVPTSVLLAPVDSRRCCVGTSTGLVVVLCCEQGHHVVVPAVGDAEPAGRVRVHADHVPRCVNTRC